MGITHNPGHLVGRLRGHYSSFIALTDSCARPPSSPRLELKKFATRELEEAYPYLILDARYEKVQEDGVILSGHFKTGQRWSLQNRPTGMARDGVVLPLWDWTRQARFSPPTPRAAFEDVAVMEQPVQHGCDGGAITQ